MSDIHGWTTSLMHVAPRAERQEPVEIHAPVDVERLAGIIPETHVVQFLDRPARRIFQRACEHAAGQEQRQRIVHVMQQHDDQQTAEPVDRAYRPVEHAPILEPLAQHDAQAGLPHPSRERVRQPIQEEAFHDNQNIHGRHGILLAIMRTEPPHRASSRRHVYQTTLARGVTFRLPLPCRRYDAGGTSRPPATGGALGGTALRGVRPTMLVSVVYRHCLPVRGVSE